MDGKSSEGNNQQSALLNKRLSRRGVIAGAVTLAAGAIAPRFIHEAQALDTEIIPEPTLTPELIANKPIEFGFNTHLYADRNAGSNLTLERFKKDVDFMVANDMKAIRLNIWPGESVQGGSPTDVEWHEEQMKIYDEAIEYAVDKNKLNMYLVTNVPDYGNTYPPTSVEYLTLTRTYYTELATRYKGKGITYQIFNEPDLHRFNKYTEAPELTDEYITSLGTVIEAASEAIKAIDPEARVTVNINKWRDSGAKLVEKGTRIFDALQDSVDVITLDFYPFDDEGQIADLPKFVAYFKDRYKLPVVIGELGMPTEGFDDFSIADQAIWIPKAIEALKAGPVTPEAVLLYAITDWANAGNQSEQNYGIFDEDGSPKGSVEPILVAIKSK